MEDTKYGLGENPPYSLYSVASEGETLWGLVDKDGHRLDAVFHRTDDDRFYCVPHEVVEFDPEEGFSLLAWFDPAAMDWLDPEELEEQRKEHERRLALVPQEYKDLASKFVDEDPESAVRMMADLFVQTCGYSYGCRVLIATIAYPFLDRLRKMKHPGVVGDKKGTFLSILANFNDRIAANPEEFSRYEISATDLWDFELNFALEAMKELLGFCPDHQARAALCWALIERIDEFE